MTFTKTYATIKGPVRVLGGPVNMSPSSWRDVIDEVDYNARGFWRNIGSSRMSVKVFPYSVELYLNEVNLDSLSELGEKDRMCIAVLHEQAEALGRIAGVYFEAVENFRRVQGNFAESSIPYSFDYFAYRDI